jgi:tetratricopeptide (TPR) repeat protein
MLWLRVGLGRVATAAELGWAMAEERGSRAAGLLVGQAWAATGESRYQQAPAAAGRAVRTARHLKDPILLVRGLAGEAEALKLRGEHAAAVGRYTEILGLANDPGTRDRLNDPPAARAVAQAHWNWVECAWFLTGIPVRDLCEMLDATDRWLDATGRRHWRAIILLQRALLHNRLAEHEAAVACAEEAPTIALRHPDVPAYTLGTHRFQLGDGLRNAGSAGEAVPHYQTILDHPDSGGWSRWAAHEGLAWCALDTGDPAAARREAQVAEPLGDNALCTAMDALAACRADGDLEAAWQAATRRLEAAGRIGGHYRPYYVSADRSRHRAGPGRSSRCLADPGRAGRVCPRHRRRDQHHHHHYRGGSPPPAAHRDR